jgi:hypothetical protein
MTVIGYTNDGYNEYQIFTETDEDGLVFPQIAVRQYGTDYPFERISVNKDVTVFDILVNTMLHGVGDIDNFDYAKGEYKSWELNSLT